MMKTRNRYLLTGCLLAGALTLVQGAVADEHGAPGTMGQGMEHMNEQGKAHQRAMEKQMEHGKNAREDRYEHEKRDKHEKMEKQRERMKKEREKREKKMKKEHKENNKREGWSTSFPPAYHVYVLAYPIQELS